MSDAKQDGGPAFPRPYVIDNESSPDAPYKLAQEGMSLRDYYIGQALAGLCANPVIAEKNLDRPDDVAGAAIECADAVLKAREK